jgi:aminoglycoside phosphotransferase (APT) family kinase protein
MTDKFDPTFFTADFVSRLVAAQVPQWAGLPVREVSLQGWDNRTFRLGDDLSVRLPSAAGYVPQIEKEHRWLPCLAPCLPLPIPAPIAKGQPALGYPSEWSIYRWLPGEPVATACIPDLDRFASDLAGFLGALYRVDPGDGPPAGPHSFYRGGPLATYDAETRRSIDVLRDEIDAGAATRIWEEALAAEWHGPPVWVHGDVAVANLLVQDGRLSAVIDFGSSAVGDPACDTVIAWTYLTGYARHIFRKELPVDQGAWTRGRGWALWKALILIAGTDPIKANDARRVLKEVLGSPL